VIWWGSDPHVLVLPVGPDRRAAAMGVLADLAGASDEDLLAAHRYVLEAASRANGADVVRIGLGPLRELAGEVKRRGLQTLDRTREARDALRAGRLAWLD
jgi:chloramphenicol 3-O-phosphotransferase